MKKTPFSVIGDRVVVGSYTGTQENEVKGALTISILKLSLDCRNSKKFDQELKTKLGVSTVTVQNFEHLYFLRYKLFGVEVKSDTFKNLRFSEFCVLRDSFSLCTNKNDIVNYFAETPFVIELISSFIPSKSTSKLLKEKVIASGNLDCEFFGTEVLNGRNETKVTKIIPLVHKELSPAISGVLSIAFEVCFNSDVSVGKDELSDDSKMENSYSANFEDSHDDKQTKSSKLCIGNKDIDFVNARKLSQTNLFQKLEHEFAVRELERVKAFRHMESCFQALVRKLKDELLAIEQKKRKVASFELDLKRKLKTKMEDMDRIIKHNTTKDSSNTRSRSSFTKDRNLKQKDKQIEALEKKLRIIEIRDKENIDPNIQKTLELKLCSLESDLKYEKREKESLLLVNQELQKRVKDLTNLNKLSSIYKDKRNKARHIKELYRELNELNGKILLTGSSENEKEAGQMKKSYQVSILRQELISSGYYTPESEVIQKLDEKIKETTKQIT
eukprot:snap_masked-scaffold_7-processed-gene-7.14-mRNA-1 protein AED:1.00 eAED:1.00 QI:0/-1/0/0/-1/1/1/0/500